MCTVDVKQQHNNNNLHDYEQTDNTINENGSLSPLPRSPYDLYTDGITNSLSQMKVADWKQKEQGILSKRTFNKIPLILQRN